MKELSPLATSALPAATADRSRPGEASSFDELLAEPPPQAANAPQKPAGAPRQAAPAEGADATQDGQDAPTLRPAQDGLPSRARPRKPEGLAAKADQEGEDKPRRGRAPVPGEGAPLQPPFAAGPQPLRSAQAAGAAQLKGNAVTGASSGATKVTPQAAEAASRKPSTAETGESPSHRSEAIPLAAQPGAPPSAAPGAEPVAPPPLPAPVALAAMDLPTLHLAILPNVARLSVSTDEGDVRVQLKVKDSVANLRVEGAGAAAFQRAPEELRVLLAQAGLSLGSFEMGQGGGQQPQDGREHVVPFEPEVAAGFVTPRAPDASGTEGEEAHPRQVRVRA